MDETRPFTQLYSVVCTDAVNSIEETGAIYR